MYNSTVLAHSLRIHVYREGRDDEDNFVDSTPVFVDFLARLEALRQKNVAAYDLTRQVRSS